MNRDDGPMQCISLSKKKLLGAALLISCAHAGPIHVEETMSDDIMDVLNQIAAESSLKTNEFDLSIKAQGLVENYELVYLDAVPAPFVQDDFERLGLGGEWTMNRKYGEPRAATFSIEDDVLVMQLQGTKRYVGGLSDDEEVLILEHRSKDDEILGMRVLLHLVFNPAGTLEGWNQSLGGDEGDPEPVVLSR